MILEEVTPVPLADLPLAAFRTHLRLGSGFGEDTLQDAVLESLLRAAMAAVETRIGKVLIAREFLLILDQWGSAGRQSLPMAPVQSVISVVLVDAAGGRSALAEAGWRLRADVQEPQIVAPSGRLPGLASGAQAEIAFVAGFGGWADVPADLQQATFMLAAHYYENRDAVHLPEGCVPFGVTALLQAHRKIRIGLGAGQ